MRLGCSRDVQHLLCALLSWFNECMPILKKAAFMKPPFTVKTEVHGVKGVWVVQVLAEACTGINNDGLKHNVRDRVLDRWKQRDV